MRAAFGTFLGSTDPLSVFGDAEFLRPRFTAAPSWVFAAELGGGAGAGSRFERLLDGCEQLAAGRSLGRLVAGVNTARHDAYRRLLRRGYRTWREGVIMQKGNDPGYCRSDVHVIDDLR
jgi:hypothetical protein